MDKIDIKDISGNIRFSAPIKEGSKRHFLLMQEDYITLLFSLSYPIYFTLGDYIDNELGIFELVDLYKPTYNTTTGGYDYELRLDAYYWKWKNKKFFYTPNTTGREAGWNLTATLDKHLNVFLDNLKALGYKFREENFTYEIDNTVANTSKLVSYDNVNLIDALTQMAETWECEWWITEHVIHFGRCEYSSPVDFKAGDLTDTENVNVNGMTRSDSQTTYATRIYAFGSTRNIPSSYRKELIFDVKEVNGRNISDTSRPLKENYFPLSSVSWDQYSFESGVGGMIFSKGETTSSATVTPSLPAGMYYLKKTSDWILTLSPLFVAGANVSKGWYGGYLSIQYNKGNETFTLYNVVSSFQLDNDIYESTSKIYSDVPDVIELEIPEGASNLRVELRSVVTSDLPLISTVHFGASLSFELYAKEKNVDTSVSFLSGVHVGETFPAVCIFLYNGNGQLTDTFLRLPEGVTAPLGDRYTIDNIIKGKVPDSYFSKDDKEMTLNGVVQKRLMLPEGISYVDAYKYSPTGERINIGDERYDDPDNVEMPEEEAIEEIVIFEDEYPKYIGSTTIVPDPTWEDEKVDDKPTGNKYPIYTFKDTGLKNFTKDFLLEELHLIFQTGKLAGLDFALTLKESDNTGTTFEIVRNEDYGRALPDDVLFPQATHKEEDKDVPADTYILYGFDPAYISEQISPDAEQNLLKKAKEYVKESMIDPSTYDCEMDADWIYNKGNIRTYEVGAKVNLINKAFFPEGRQSRIIGFEWPLDIPYDHPIYTVGETASYSRIGEIESRLDSLTYKGQTYSGSAIGGGGTSVYIIGVNDKTLPSDRNVFSSKKSLATFLNKTQEETMEFLIKLLGGVIADNIESQGFISGALGSGFLIKRDPKTGRSYIEVDEIYVRLKAIFESLTIKELQSVGGEVLLTLASIECTKVEKITEAALYSSDRYRLYDSKRRALRVLPTSAGVYRCYFKADDGEKAILNQFAAGDFAQCRQFNLKSGVYENVANRYYWRYVLSVGGDYIDLSVNDCAPNSDIPQAGDKIIQLGNRIDPARQNAILLSAYGLTAPTIQMLQGIDSYSLDGKAVKEEGFDQNTQQFYSKNYGRSYVGDRERKSYMEYVPGSGLEARCSIKGISDDGNSVYDLRPDGTCFFGKTDPDTGKKTGIIQGVDCLIGGTKRTGIFAVVNDEVVFELDPVTKQYKFTGEIETDKGKIGGFDIDSYSLENKDSQPALISVRGKETSMDDKGDPTIITRQASLGNAIPTSIGIDVSAYMSANGNHYGENIALMLRSSGSTKPYNIFGGKANFCIDAVGGSNWKMNEGDHWCMPGVLMYVYFETWYNNGSPSRTVKSWGNGIEIYSIGYEQAGTTSSSGNYIIIKYYSSHDRIMCLPQNMGMDWNGENRWGLTPTVESINDIVKQGDPPLRQARITFWHHDGGKYIPNRSLYVFVGEPS